VAGGEVGSDQELWGQTLAGSTAAFGLLVERHAHAVYNHCFRLTASWTAAEELTSAVFLHVWRCREQLRLAEPAIDLGLAPPANAGHRAGERRATAASPLTPPPERILPDRARTAIRARVIALIERPVRSPRA
jgi:Sigma-70 region 2